MSAAVGLGAGMRGRGSRNAGVGCGRTVRDIPRDAEVGRMQEVTVSRELEAPRETVLEALSPRDIVEYAGTYEVWDVEETDDGWAVSCGTEELDVVLDFERVDGGYIYRQREGRGPFGEMYTGLAIDEDDPVVVIARSCYTFDGRLARLLDWLAAHERRTELRRLLTGLELAVDGDDAPG